MAPRRRKYRDRLITEAFFAQASSSEKLFKCPHYGCVADGDPEKSHQHSETPHNLFEDFVPAPAPTAEHKNSMALMAYVEKGENPIVGQEIRKLYSEAGANLVGYYAERPKLGEDPTGFKKSRFREEMDLGLGEDEERFRENEIRFRDKARASTERVVEDGTAVTEGITPFMKKRWRRRKTRARGESSAKIPGLELNERNVDPAKRTAAPAFKDIPGASHGDVPRMVDSGCDMSFKDVDPIEAAECAGKGQHWDSTAHHMPRNGTGSSGEDTATPNKVEQKKKKRRRRRQTAVGTSIKSNEDTRSATKERAQTSSVEEASKEDESPIPPFFESSQQDSSPKAEFQSVLDHLFITSVNVDVFIAHNALQKIILGNFLRESNRQGRQHFRRGSIRSVVGQGVTVMDSLQSSSENLHRSICSALRDLKLFNLEKRWGLVEERTARIQHAHGQLVNGRGIEPFPYSLREVLNNPMLCLRNVKSTDEGREGERTRGKDAAVEFRSQKMRGAKHMRSVSETERSVSMTIPRQPTFFKEPIPRDIPEKVRQNMLDFEFTLAQISAARDPLFVLRNAVGKLVINWATASLQAWELGKKHWRSLPVTVSYDYNRADFLAMFEQAKLLEHWIVTYFTSKDGRLQLNPSLSIRFMLDELPELKAESREKLWDDRIAAIHPVLPTVAHLLHRVDSIFRASGDSSEERDVSIDDWCDIFGQPEWPAPNGGMEFLRSS